VTEEEDRIRAREFLKTWLPGPCVPGDEWNNELAIDFAIEFARSEREAIALDWSDGEIQARLKSEREAGRREGIEQAATFAYTHCSDCCHLTKELRALADKEGSWG